MRRFPAGGIGNSAGLWELSRWYSPRPSCLLDRAAGKFKTHGFSVVAEVEVSGEPVTMTKRGRPSVKVVPIAFGENDLFGFMAGEFQIAGEVESTVVPTGEWEVMKK
jgi:prevent-host-death family protein